MASYIKKKYYGIDETVRFLKVKGKIVEDGSLEFLLENKESHFYKLWQMQAEGFIPSIPE